MEPITRGGRGEAVRDVQHRLLGAGLRIEAEELEGFFGASTEGAVREFQRVRGLPADGKVGSDTWGQLVEASYRLGDRTLYLRSPAFRGDDVRELQRLLNALGFDAGKQDGIFGRRTTVAIREFQRNVGTRVDGIVGLDTVRDLTRYRPPAQAQSRAVIREEEAARASGLVIAGSLVAIDADDGPVERRLAEALSSELEARGARPLLLHSGEGGGSVEVRVRRANAREAGVVLSLGVGAPGEQGCACFHFGTPTTHSPMGRRIAESIQARILAVLGSPDRGVGPLSIGILRETRMPAIRIEPCAADDSAVDDADFYSKVAGAITDALQTFPSAPPSPTAR